MNFLTVEENVLEIIVWSYPWMKNVLFGATEIEKW